MRKLLALAVLCLAPLGASAQTKVPLTMLDSAVAPKTYVDSAIATEVAARNAAITAATSGITAGAKAANRQVFTANGTWTKPTGFGANAIVFIEAWGGGGSGMGYSAAATSAGGGGGGYSQRWVPLASLGATETVTIGAGGAAPVYQGQGNNGGNSSFGAWLTAYGGSGGGISSLGWGGGGGGQLSASTDWNPGKPWTVVDNDGTNGNFRAGQGGNGNYLVANYGTFYHGGGGAGGGNPGGPSVYGGGGGAGGTGQTGGASKFGGNGGNSGVAGSAPGGGGGGNVGATGGAGARGEVRITVFDGV